MYYSTLLYIILDCCTKVTAERLLASLARIEARAVNTVDGFLRCSLDKWIQALRL